MLHVIPHFVLTISSMHQLILTGGSDWLDPPGVGSQQFFETPAAFLSCLHLALRPPACSFSKLVVRKETAKRQEFWHWGMEAARFSEVVNAVGSQLRMAFVGIWVSDPGSAPTRMLTIWALNCPSPSELKAHGRFFAAAYRYSAFAAAPPVKSRPARKFQQGWLSPGLSGGLSWPLSACPAKVTG